MEGLFADLIFLTLDVAYMLVSTYCPKIGDIFWYDFIVYALNPYSLSLVYAMACLLMLF